MTAGAGQANPATSLPIFPSTNVFDRLKLTQTCLDYGESSMGIWGTILLVTGTFCTAKSRTTPKYKHTIEKLFNAMIPINEANFSSDDEIEKAVSAFLKACQIPFMLFPAPKVCTLPLKIIEMLRQLANPTIDTAAKFGAENVGAVVGRLQHTHDMVKGVRTT